MPLVKKQQTLLNSLIWEIITDINEASSSDDQVTLIYIKLAVDLPKESSEEEFSRQVSFLDDTVKEKLVELRDLYLGKEKVLGQGIRVEDIKAAVHQYLIQYEEKINVQKGLAEHKIHPGATSVSPLSQLRQELDLKPGDLVISEPPYEDAKQNDFIHFRNFVPGHSSVWTGEGFDKPFAHAVREGYRPPGLKLSSIWEGRHLVFRYSADPQIAAQAARIMRSWASAEVMYTKERYQRVYPARFWGRHQRDLVNYFGGVESKTEIAGPATPFGEPRSSYDLLNLARNKNLAVLGQEGLRRAIKFASLRELARETVSKKGQRCTAVVVAAFQASILAPLVLARAHKQPFKEFKGKSLLEYADQVLVPDWRESPLGGLLLKAMETNDYSGIFPPPFAVDQRYATPENLYAKLKETPGFELVGKFSCYDNKLVLVERNKNAQTTPLARLAP